MAKVNKEYEARMQGMIYACNLVEKEGLETLKKDIKMRGITNFPLQISHDKAGALISDLAENLYTTFLTMTMIALEDAYGFKKVRLMRFKESFDKHTRATYDMDWLGKHYVSISEYVRFLREDCGIDLSKDFEATAAKCQYSTDKSNPDYKMVHLDRLVVELSENGYEKAAEYLLQRFAVQEMEENIKEDYAEGCFKENYMKPHVCPIATGGWCRDYVKCKSMEGNQSPPGPSFLGRDDSGKGSTS